MFSPIQAGITEEYKVIHSVNFDNAITKNCKYIIKQTEAAKSGTGSTSYYGTEILDKHGNTCELEYGNVKIRKITRSYWWDLGKFNEGESAIFFPKYTPPGEIEPNFCLFPAYLDFVINQKSDSAIVCFYEITDAKGYSPKLVKGCLNAAKDLEIIIFYLNLLNEVESFATFKLLITLSQLHGLTINRNIKASVERYNNFVDNVLQQFYDDSLKYNRQQHMETTIEGLYPQVKNTDELFHLAFNKFR